jgi:RimJ/RimL family protein N-acetyltransferase
VVVRDLTPGDIATIAGWRYPGRYATYDFDDPSVLASDHWAVCDEDRLVGYCCFGAPARVGAVGAEPFTVDVGYGLAPELMGQGRGRRFVGAILEFAAERHDARRFRLFILDWNARSRALAERLGFVYESTVVSGDDTFVVMTGDSSSTTDTPRSWNPIRR